MKIVVLHLNTIDPAEFLDDESLNTGLHGLLDSRESASPFQLLRGAVETAGVEWRTAFLSFDAPEMPMLLDEDGACLVGLSAARGDLVETLAAVVSGLSGDVILMSLSAIDGEGCRAFALTTSEGLAAIRIDDIPARDVVATILELAALDALGADPAGGRSLVPLLGQTAGAASESDEEIVRDRLRGLGYIA